MKKTIIILLLLLINIGFSQDTPIDLTEWIDKEVPEIIRKRIEFDKLKPAKNKD